MKTRDDLDEQRLVVQELIDDMQALDIPVICIGFEVYDICHRCSAIFEAHRIDGVRPDLCVACLNRDYPGWWRSIDT